MTMDDEIRKAAGAFRMALDQVSSEAWKQALIDSFPKGACGHCSEMLARHLKEEFDVTVIYASGWVSYCSGRYTHAWLEHEELIIDISADQFGLAPVVVSRHSRFHEAISETDRHPIIDDNWVGQHAVAVWKEVNTILHRTT